LRKGHTASGRETREIADELLLNPMKSLTQSPIWGGTMAASLRQGSAVRRRHLITRK